jgi:two-component system, OmpR family, sensor kinase
MGDPAYADDVERPPAKAAKRLLDTLERLLELPSADLKVTLSHAADLAADATGADKVDAFLYDSTRDSLVAVGSSNQPLSARQRKLGLDVLPVSNGGRVVHVYQTGQTFVTGRLDEDAEELRGVKEGLGIRSKIGVPLAAAGVRRGMMMLASLKPDYFTSDDVAFAEAIGRWTAEVAHRAELIEDIRRNAVAQGRRAAAEELVTVLAHDARNLMAPLETRLQILHRRAEAERRADDLADLRLALQALRRFRELVSDILDVARIDQGLFHGVPRAVDVTALIESIARTMESPAHPVHVQVRATGTLLVGADEARLRQCLENLIANAIQKSPRDAAVDVLVSSETRDTEEWLLVEVVDQGPGVPEHLLPHIFERYTSGAHREGGLGLGLYLAKEIALMHGGDLTVESTPQRGACFILTLPCVPKT